MNVLCIAASNSRKPIEQSVSYKVCQVAAAQMQTMETSHSVDVNVISLKNYDLQPCQLCGNCSENNLCDRDPAFNKIFDAMQSADRILFVVPHYSPIPSKLMALFEKINEISYGGWLKDPEYRSPVQNKSFAVIGHGGMTETPDVLKYYNETLVQPVRKSLQSLGLTWVKPQEGEELSSVFGLSDDLCLKTVSGELFPEIIIEEHRIAERIAPVVAALIRIK